MFISALAWSVLAPVTESCHYLASPPSISLSLAVENNPFKIRHILWPWHRAVQKIAFWVSVQGYFRSERVYQFKVPFTHFKQNFLPASFQSKLPEQGNTSLVIVPIVPIHVYDPFWGYGPNTGKWRIRGLNRSWFCMLRGFYLNVETEKHHMAQDPGGREGVAEWIFSLERYSCTSFDLCAGALSRRSLIPGMPEVSQDFFCSMSSVPKGQSLCSTPPWCFFLPCVASVTQCPLSKKKILCRVPSFQSSDLGHIPTFWNSCFVCFFSESFEIILPGFITSNQFIEMQ